MAKVQSDSNKFMDYISKKYKSYEQEVIPQFIGENICKIMSEGEKKDMFKYQEFLYKYMEELNTIPEIEMKNRGLLVYHGMGSGKTFSGILMANACRKYNLDETVEDYTTKPIYKRKIIMLMPASLVFDPWIKELSSKINRDVVVQKALSTLVRKMKGRPQNSIKKAAIELLREHDYHIIFYNAHNIVGGWADKLRAIPSRKDSSDKYYNRFSERDNEFDDSVLIIDEIHNLTNMFVNKIIQKTANSRSMALYKKIFESKNTRIIALSGTPIVNRPFEIAMIANIVRGKVVNNPNIKFSLSVKKFNEEFFDIDASGGLSNERMLKRRLNGMISYYKGADESVFAQKVEDKVKVAMSSQQMVGYKIARDLEYEAQENKGIIWKNNDGQKEDTILSDIPSKKGQNDDPGELLFRIKASNVVFPSYLFDENMNKINSLTRNGKAIKERYIKNKNRFLDGKGVPEQAERIIKILNNDNKPLSIKNDLKKISTKMYHIIKRAMKSNGKCVIYSRFAGIFGIQLITEALKQNGFKDYEKTKSQGSEGAFMIWTGKQRNVANKEVFNSMKNVNGEIIKIICITASGKEGINLTGIRQMHILEPWWNNALIDQVVARGLRICSHHHIPEDEFIDLRIHEDSRTDKVRLVNVFRYFAYEDMRNKMKVAKNMSKKDRKHLKRMIVQDMEMHSIDALVGNIADRKSVMEKMITEAMKEVAIDCNINKIRNKRQGESCFVDHKVSDYFKDWETTDDMVIKMDNRIKRVSGDLVVDNRNVVYKDMEQDSIVDTNLDNNKAIKVGKMEGGEIIMDEDVIEEKKVDIVKLDNKFRDVLVDILEHKNVSTKKALHITNINENTILFQKTFKKLDILSFEDTVYDDKLKDMIISNMNVQHAEFVDLQTEMKKQDFKYDYIILDPTMLFPVSLERLCNKLANHCKYVIVDTRGEGVIVNSLLNKMYYNSDNGVLVIDSTKPRTGLMKFIVELFPEGKRNKVVDDMNKLGIETTGRLKKLVKKGEYKTLDHIISPKKVEKIDKMVRAGVKQLKVVEDEEKAAEEPKKTGKMSEKDCLKKKVKDIKKSSEYKSLPKSVGKSKLNKSKLCKQIAKH